MATQSSIFTWRIPWTEEPCWVWFIGSQSQTRLKHADQQKLREFTPSRPSRQEMLKGVLQGEMQGYKNNKATVVQSLSRV